MYRRFGEVGDEGGLGAPSGVVDTPNRTNPGETQGPDGLANDAYPPDNVTAQEIAGGMPGLIGPDGGSIGRLPGCFPGAPCDSCRS